MKNSSLSNHFRILGCLLAGFALASCSDSVEVPKEVAAFVDKLPETVDYNLHVKPILSDRCELPPGYPHNRLGLAKWLLDESNPLFARVMVNRFWQQYFGNGLVKTQEEFGNQGELPSHPELLEWLAVQFRYDGANGWDIKAFIRRMVLLAMYRQSSSATKEQLEADPDNKWLARGSSYRYAAEQVRDNVLAASGLLVREIGGPSVYPYQPAVIWKALATRNTVNQFMSPIFP
jgi:hypothetical protein